MTVRAHRVTAAAAAAQGCRVGMPKRGECGHAPRGGPAASSRRNGRKAEAGVPRPCPPALGIVGHEARAHVHNIGGSGGEDWDTWGVSGRIERLRGVWRGGT
eukprot:gene6176-3443_t